MTEGMKLQSYEVTLSVECQSGALMEGVVPVCHGKHLTQVIST